ncbi:hypothetical protein BD309DRAFT_541749 [Dichomitus squalens]|uniref:Uncharacterized protein n=1 Tax=Dichomitus squalens TaxID=114155 RepID=A0A4Q9Q206_9APHY|nr:hypothetical protein BD311DRAFT_115524 [Dichomitus squalens]TBU47020.1 hypothetical protein BD309DRAFT_541749 [Dichomitus squalens]TBU61125.1 hypothetical protein BD310DRAFT_975383 [Dichomitus squalens]
MSDSLTDQRHNDFVGGEASRGRIPGADKATTGHNFVAVGELSGQKRHAHRAEEHLPPSTGRDAPPAGGVAPGTRAAVAGNLPSDILSARGNAPRQPSPVRRTDGTPHPLSPAPDSRTVIDDDPFEKPTSAGDTLTGATSADVHQGLGHPGQGQTSAELHHDGKAHRKRQMQGTDQYGSGEIPRDIDADS